MVATDFRNQEALAAGVFTRRVGLNLHILLEQMAAFLDELQTEPSIQAGNTTLDAGVSPFIPADITSTSCIFTHLLDMNGTERVGEMVWAAPSDRVIGSANDGGGFVLRATDFKGNADATDHAIYHWEVVNPQ